MQNFSSPGTRVAGTGVALLGAALEWAAGRQPATPSQPLAVAEPAHTRPLLEIDSRLAELLDIDIDIDIGVDEAAQRTRRDAPSDATVFKPSAAAAKEAAALIVWPLSRARQWINLEMTRNELANQGISTSLVEKCLKRIVERFLQGHPARGRNGNVETVVRLPQIPTAHDLFSYAVLDAQVAHALRSVKVPADAPGSSPTPTATTATAATTTTTTATSATTTTRANIADGIATTTTVASTATSTPASTASTRRMLNGYYVESSDGPIRNHAQAMATLKNFHAHIRSHLPQLGAPTQQGFWGLREGKVVLASLDIALATIPCAETVHASPGRPSTVTYPSGSAGRLQRIMIDGKEVMFARGANSHRVLYSENGINWYDKQVYTDDAIEAQKLALWNGIIVASKSAADNYRKAARWMPWR